MPIYSYRCSTCGFENDHLQKLTEPVLTVCPQCGKASYLKQVTAAGFQLKGTGWYVTDFRDRGTSKPSPANEESPATSKEDSSQAQPTSKPQEQPQAPASGSAACADS